MPLKILATGSGVTLQDAGRGGWQRFGVPVAGAMDRSAMLTANQLLGNKPAAPVLEIQLQGAKLKVLKDCWLGLAGADRCPQLPAWTASQVKAGTVLEFSGQARGIYSYLSVPGGFVADLSFGSVSVDPRNGLGEPLCKGSLLEERLGEPQVTVGQIARRIVPKDERPSYSTKESFSLLPGPEFESFNADSRQQLVTAEWSVTARSDRTGFRLEGPALKVPDSLRSEPVLPGSFQIPGSGLPIITMVDGPTVGGYPKIAILKDVDRDRLAQCAPGTTVCFQWA